MRSVLLIDDDPAILGFLESAFRRFGFSVAVAYTADQGLESYARDSTDLIVLDLNLPDIHGQEVLNRLRATDPDTSVIVLTGQADVQTAVEAMLAGAENFLTKPIDLTLLKTAVERAFEKVSLRRRSRYLEERVHPPQPVAAPPAKLSSAMADIHSKVALIAPTDTTVLILGETGTGKSWIARQIHERSKRARAPFVEVNCASLSATFLDSELFGHEKGAFTDAKVMKRGLLEIADGGTLFLDEIGDLALNLQPKLLHVLETKRFRRLGGTRDLESDVRLVAATNHNLKQAVAAGNFREDLYYRLAVMPFVLPPLRERDESELESIAQELLIRLQAGSSMTAKKITPEALRMLTDYQWPGNIREMRNVLERALILVGHAQEITPAVLPPELRPDEPLQSAMDLPVNLTLQQVEEQHIQRVLAYCGGNRSRAARVLGLSRVGLYKKLRRLEGSPATPAEAEQRPATAAARKPRTRPHGHES